LLLGSNQRLLDSYVITRKVHNATALQDT
jgi:hypothetical protein